MEPDTRTRAQLEQEKHPKARFDCEYIFLNREHMYFDPSPSRSKAECCIDNQRRDCEGKCSQYNPGIIGRIKKLFGRDKIGGLIRMDKLFLEGGDLDKFIVLKVEDIDKYTGSIIKAALLKADLLIKSGRERDRKKKDNTYLVINTDEPYAPEVVEILKRNGHWGKDGGIING